MIDPSRQGATARSSHARHRLRALPAGLLLMSALTFAGLVPCQADSPSGEPIGILLAAGDITECKESGSKHAETAAQIQQEIDAANGLPVGILALGDLAYAEVKNKKLVPGTYGECFDRFEATWGAHKERLFPVPGNHESSDDIPAKNKPTPLKRYRDYFADRLTDLKKASGVAPGPADKSLNFSTRFPDENGWQLVGLNLYRDVAPQKWLPGQLSASTARCVLVFAHEFFISSGKHGKGKINQPMAKAMPILYAQGATVLVAGHDHDLEQFPKVDGKGKPDPTKGVRSFVVGTGGANLYPDFTKHLLSEFFTRKSRGLLKLTLYRDGYKWSFVTVDGPAAGLPAGEETCNRKPPA